MVFHVPVLVDEVLEALVGDRSGIYLDATAGGGGHSRAIALALDPPGRLIALDRDTEAVAAAGRALADFGGQVQVVHGRFAEIGQLLAERGVPRLCGVLFDLGVSSHQLAESGRGFSYQAEGPLDMRMDSSQGLPAATLIAGVSEAELAGLLRRYGEERRARQIARSVCRARASGRLQTTADLAAAVRATRPRHAPKTLARVFQALRIAVNDELGQLERGLDGAVEALAPGGRVAVIAYHSLEDRLVKAKFAELLRGCVCPPKLPVCVCHREPQFKAALRKPCRPSAEEVTRNRRARSAILRVYEKI